MDLKIKTAILSAILIVSYTRVGCVGCTTDNEMDVLRSTLSGLRAQRRLMQQVLLPTSDVPQGDLSKFWDVLQVLTEMDEYSGELDSLLAPPENENNTELVAIQFIVQHLKEDSCNWMKLKLGEDFNCTTSELARLKSKLDGFNQAWNAYRDISNYMRIQGINDLCWVCSNIRCDVPDETLTLLNQLFQDFFRHVFPRRGENFFTQGNCEQNCAYILRKKMCRNFTD